MPGEQRTQNEVAPGSALAVLVAMLALVATATASAETGNACGYREAALSVPAYQVSSAEVGHPWRALYGYCLTGGQQFVLHQDWALSYLDGDPVSEFPGGEGVGLGTDLLLRWHPDWQPGMIPHIDAGLGIQYAAGNPFPADGSRWMFTLQAGAGWRIPTNDNRQATVSLRYLHLSNAGLTGNNSGYDVVHLVFGVRWGRNR